MADLISPSELPSLLQTIPEWSLENRGIRRLWTFLDFAEAMAFVNRVAVLAEEVNHHPDIDIRWNKVTLFLSTHSKSGLTELDFKLAKKIDALG